MIRNYLKVAFRNIARQKSYSFINIAGLGIGMAVCVLITLWVQSELNFDKFHEKSDRIYRLTNVLTIGGIVHPAATSSAPMVPAILSKYPEVVGATRILPIGETWVKYGEKQFKEENLIYADSSFFKVFTFPLMAGNPQTALQRAYSIVVSEETAEKYFGDEEALGKTLRLDGEHDYAVTGVVKNVPNNSHLKFDMLLSLETAYVENRQNMEMWGRLGIYSYLLLSENADARDLESKLGAIIEENFGERLKTVGATLELFLQKLADIHLYSHLENEFSGNSDIAYIYLFSGVAVLVLLMACFNFVNLTTARSSRRALEISVRKTFGAARSRLLVQFLTESVLCSLLAVLLTIFLLKLTLPLFNDLTERSLEINYLSNPVLLLSLIGFAVLVGILAGGFPALHMSSFEPVRILKGGFTGGSGKSIFRRILVVIQFSITIALIIGTLTVYKQINYIRNKNLGFDREQVVIIPNLSNLPVQTRYSLGDELSDLPGVVQVSAASAVPARGGFTMTNFLPEGFAEDESQLMIFMSADEHYVDALGMRIVAGRNFSTDLVTDSGRSVLINETAARKFGWENAVGKILKQRVQMADGVNWAERTVVGVVADFHYSSLHQAIMPVAISREVGLPAVPFNLLAVRLARGDISNTMDRIKEKWEKLSGGQPADFFFLDDTVNRQYLSEGKLGNLALSFSLLAVFIGCLGLFGMASHVAEQRTKEIGIRKTLGASVNSIVRLLSRESFVLVILSNVLAWPAAGYLMNRWLQNFAYRISLSWETFVLAGLLTLVIALGTVGIQSARAAVSDPVKALRYE